MFTVTVKHTIDAGHRVYGHTAFDGLPGKCSRLHGHTYAFEVELGADILDDIGFVVDFGKVKGVLNEWDHRLLLWERDPFLIAARQSGTGPFELIDEVSGVVRLPFNPTAEAMAQWLVDRMLDLDDRILVVRVSVSETPKTIAHADSNRWDRTMQEKGEAIIAGKSVQT